MRHSKCINASLDKQWSFTKTRGSLRQLVKSMLRVSSLIKASPLSPDTVSILAGLWRHTPMIGLKCLSVRQLSWTNDSLCCLLEWHDNLILWARQGKSDLGALYWGWGKLTRADKSLPWAINRIKEQQTKAEAPLFGGLCFSVCLSKHSFTKKKNPLHLKLFSHKNNNHKLWLHH